MMTMFKIRDSLFVLSVEIVIFSSLSTECESARILGIMPTSAISHQLVFQPLWKELSLRGHRVVVLTTHPMKDRSLTNLTELHLDFVNTYFEEVQFYGKFVKTDNFFELGFHIRKITIELTHKLLENKLLREFMRYNPSFDLVIAEAHFPSILGLIGYYKCPWIGVSSLEPAFQYHLAVGNQVHPVLNPDSNLKIDDVDDLTFFERFSSFVYRNAYMHNLKYDLMPRLNAISRNYLGEDLPHLIAVQNNVSMIFSSAHPLFHSLRSVYPNTVYVGSGMHLKEPESLPNELQTFLDEARRGAIYFSLGSNVDAKILDEQFIEALMDTFANLPYHVLLKLDSEMTDVPKNVLVRKWMPQQDILRHRNVKLFITQGGLQSLQEAITNDVPLIGIPFFGDQLSNVNKMVKRGYGIKLDKKKITKESLTNGIEEVMKNPKYREKAKEMGAIFRDEEIPSLERAVYWTEYVIRHKGAPHLRSPVVNMPAWKYYMLDVLGFLILIIILVVIVCYALVKLWFWAIINICSFANKKYKKKTN